MARSDSYQFRLSAQGKKLCPSNWPAGLLLQAVAYGSGPLVTDIALPKPTVHLVARRYWQFVLSPLREELNASPNHNNYPKIKPKVMPSLVYFSLSWESSGLYHFEAQLGGDT